jgi:DNA mismatch repair protein MutS2
VASDALASQTSVSDSQTHSYASTSLDLHGMTVGEAAAALDGFLNDALLASHAEVRVIHGRSGGRLKAAVHARLKQLPVVRATRLDPANPGVTIVTL